MKANLESLEESPPQPKVNRVGILVAALTLGSVYGSSFVEPGPFSLAVCVGALVLVALTALARLNDIKTRDHSIRWHVRRAALAIVGTTALTISYGLVTSDMPPPIWRNTLFVVGVAATWITTPDQPPWWRWVSYRDLKLNK